ncbi:MAG: FHA domain-containing protein [Tepidisphaeraceae bacterium]
MASLVVEHFEAAEGGASLDGTLTVGRGTDNDVVLEHPTVSRHHAIIERVASEYFINDLGSRNATRVNGRTVRERRPLASGDKIRFGQVRVMFIISSDAARTASLDRSQSPSMEPGILFNCPCGTRLWAKAEAATGMVTCGKCNAQVVVPSESTKADSGETVSGMSVVSRAEPEQLAAPVHTGTCSICQWPTTTEDHVTDCPDCGLTFHAECWRENCGCSAYGCAQVNALPPKVQRPESPLSIAASADSEADAEAPLEAPATSSLEEPATASGLPVAHAALATSVVGGLIGLLGFGALSLVSLIVCLTLLAKRRGSRKLLLLAAALSLVGMAGGGVVSAMWWLSWSPGVLR